MSQGLGGVRQTARDRTQERFTALLHHLTIDLLRESYYDLQRSAAHGVDGVSWQQYEQGLEARLAGNPRTRRNNSHRQAILGYTRNCAGNRLSTLPHLLTTITTVTQSAAPYNPYHITSCPGVRRRALKMTRDPVELICISCASNTLPVLL